MGQGKRSEILLHVEDLKKYYRTNEGIFQRKKDDIKAVDSMTFHMKRGETFGLVGESGCGKSTAGRMITRLLKPTAGRIYFEGEDITNLSGPHLRYVRQNLQMIFQDPYASLNPKMMVGSIVSEPLINYGKGSKRQVKEGVLELLECVGLPEEAYYHYPHQFSGGQRQRIGIARALALRPKLVVADEPVSALDVSVQSHILNLLQKLQTKFDLTLLFIAHDLSVVKHMSDRIGVMYLGHLVEIADAEAIYEEPKHPYTKALISAIPQPDPRKKRNRIILSGDTSSCQYPPEGCPFQTRCPEAVAECRIKKPELIEVKKGHTVSCLLYK
ncbi:ATP-binding cassette domain-containing protein [Salipaludibacillus sp. LMS25]|jgi:peptide/nickel transport system ATP-binding protein|uniref:ABC transporter ATP-binding protein n=1 Tax=Salipaludibacillus sp. LMS25 TaxID=2924031 RepID=UPI0020D1B78C|nr:oligopeptide/dipeptide ABC transporter ATP-binding protein [Salipaludibacillus sp. LMS25]UTR16601.1 ATP-binding cassette domain-containing protein [Salipaludibacillus sp. LMS25]